eukprot:GHUV01020796.1.p1 GENE.GHUV01020796.1~~GHUV01020796.1.p1  ORF type:complete len:131 (+),score=40.29 GHUV01020796.1:259-651(+)
MQVKVQPRLQLETWSMYWKQPSKTDTRCLDTITLKVDDAGVDTKVSTMMDQVAAQLGWAPEDGLTRLDGFTDPWQRALCRGRVLRSDDTLAAAGIAEGDVVTVVRIELIAEGWKIKDDYSLTDSDEEDDL